MSLRSIKEAIDNSQYIVCLQGDGMTEDAGCINFLDQDNAYDVELKLGYSPEELFSATFYNTRIHQFYDYYKNYILTGAGKPGEDHATLARLEEQGKLKSIITGSIYSLPQKAGCKNVLEIHGSIYDNICPRCGRRYTLSYVKNSMSIPLCEHCNSPIRPGVQLMGEMTDNQVLSEAAQEISRADLLLVLGCNLNEQICETCIKYFEGDKIVLIHPNEHFSDGHADIIYYGKTKDVLPRLVS